MRVETMPRFFRNMCGALIVVLGFSLRASALQPTITKAVSAPYGFSGAWAGAGEMRDQTNKSQACGSMVIQIRHTPTEFQTLMSRFDCGAFRISNKASETLQITQGRLFYRGQGIGSISETAIHTTLTDGSGRVQDFQMQILGNGELVYKDHVDWNAQYKTGITARFKRVVLPDPTLF